MAEHNHEQLRRLFDLASAAAPGDQGPLLDRECRGDTRLKKRVEAMIAAAEDDRFLSDPTHGLHDTTPTIDCAVAATIAAPLREGPGTRIGPYKLLQLIGEGGFGSVFMAEQEKPVARKVALKIIKLGMDTRQVVARFEQERQALAMMDHPNIARVLDAGATETGRPFFVMELVKGEPIVEYCDKNNLSIEDRLELFAQVCNAVQHAHTKGIIHRDIKPSNILVSTQDGRPHTKVIDFGIAKATASKLTEKTLFTEHRQLIGTPEYMSPEQAEGSLDIDTRTDVYSLGVLLYELLTGTTPFSSNDLRSAAYAEIQRIIREVEPPKPSTRLSSNIDTIASVAAKRQTEPKKLGVIIRGELDWIVMRALEKDRQRRYETANGLAMDIRRYLGGEAVVAAPPSASYRLRKFVRRNKGVVTAGAVVAAVLVLGMAGTAWQANRAAQQRDIAIAAKESETKQRQTAEAERDKAQIIVAFMSETLEGAGPSVAKGRDITMLKEMMDSAAARIEKGDLKAAPEAELRLRGTIGITYMELALYPESANLLAPAVALARSLHPSDHAEVAIALDNLARLLRARGNLAGAEPLYRESLAMRKRLFLGDRAEVAQSLNNLADLLQARGDLAGAEPLFREALDMLKRRVPGDDPDVAVCLNNLAKLLLVRGDLAGAEPPTRESLAMFKRLFPGDHPLVSVGLNTLAYLLRARGDLAGAEQLARESLAMQKRLFPGDHPLVAIDLGNLGYLMQMRGDAAGAEPYLRECLAMRRRVQFPNDGDIGGALHRLGSVLLDQSKWTEAEQCAREAVAILARLGGPDDGKMGGARLNLGRALVGQGRLAEAQTELIQSEREIAGAKVPNRAVLVKCLATLATLCESLDKAEPGKGHDTKAAEWKAKLDAMPAATPPSAPTTPPKPEGK